MNIFLIDDEDTFNFLNKTVVTMVLPTSKITVFTNGKEALQALDSVDELPDLIFLDMYMPIMSGWDFLDGLKGQHAELKVVMLTSSFDQSEKRKALNYPMVAGVYSKPLTVEIVKELAS